MKKIFYLLPILLIGLAFFACSNEDDDDDGGVANTFADPRIIDSSFTDVILGVEVEDQDDIDDLTDTDLANATFYKVGAASLTSGATASFGTPNPLPKVKVIYGKVVASAADALAAPLKKGEGMTYLLKFTAEEFLTSITELEVELGAGKSIANDADTKTAILAAAQKQTFYDKLDGTAKGTFDDYFKEANLTVALAAGGSSASVTVGNPSHTINLKRKAVSPAATQNPPVVVQTDAQKVSAVKSAIDGILGSTPVKSSLASAALASLKTGLASAPITAGDFHTKLGITSKDISGVDLQGSTLAVTMGTAVSGQSGDPAASYLVTIAISLNSENATSTITVQSSDNSP